MKTEMFIGGDPRLLAGGTAATTMNYGDTPATVQIMGTPAVTTATMKAGDDPFGCVATQGQKVHSGKASYHHTPAYNVFLRDGEWPSAGIELETELRRPDDDFARAAEQALRSNWFHFERDGSLDPDHDGVYGYELITEPLPPRAYRSPHLWFGLQNVVSPWLKSFECPETGLHVHVGLNQFADFDAIPIDHPMSRMSIGKMLSALIYYCVADQAFIDRVVLRKPTHYCSTPAVKGFMDGAKLMRPGGVCAAELVDYSVAALIDARNRWCRDLDQAKCRLSGNNYSHIYPTPWIDSTYLAGGHGTEINQEHTFTIEFRRAKGTIHALSVHRIVELMTSIVRFAGKICREPNFVVTREAFMDWLIETTTSEALRNLAKQMKG